MTREELAGGPSDRRPPGGPTRDRAAGRPDHGDDVLDLDSDLDGNHLHGDDRPGPPRDVVRRVAPAVRRHPGLVLAAVAALALAGLVGALVRGSLDDRARQRADAGAVRLLAWPSQVDGPAGASPVTVVSVQLLNAGPGRVTVTGASIDGLPPLALDPARLDLAPGGDGQLRLRAAVPCGEGAPGDRLRLQVSPAGSPPERVAAVTVPAELSWRQVFSRADCTSDLAPPPFVAAVVGTPRAARGKVVVDVRVSAGPQGPVSVDAVTLDVQQGSSTSPELPLRLAAGSGATVRLTVDPPACGSAGLPAQIAGSVHVRWGPEGGPEQDAYVDGGPALLTAAVHAQDQACHR